MPKNAVNLIAMRYASINVIKALVNFFVGTAMGKVTIWTPTGFVEFPVGLPRVTIMHKHTF